MNIKILHKKDNKRFKSGLVISIKRRLKKQAFVFFSSPIYSVNNNYSIIYVCYIAGPLNGGGSILLFKKKKGEWILIDRIFTWIS